MDLTLHWIPFWERLKLRLHRQSTSQMFSLALHHPCLPMPPRKILLVAGSARQTNLRTILKTRNLPYFLLKRNSKCQNSKIEIANQKMFLSVNRVLPTGLPPVNLIREKRETDQPTDYNIISSLDEVPLGLQSQLETVSRGKRWFRPVLLQTVTSYTFVSTTVTKSVNLASVAAAGGTGGAAAAGPLLCRPAGYVIC